MILCKAICLTSFVISSLMINAQNVDEILHKHFETINIVEKDKIESLKYIGMSIQKGKEFSFIQLIKKPDKNRMNVLMMGDTMVQAYDGEKGWMIAPWLGSKKAQELSAKESEALLDQVDLNGSLYKWRSKGYKLELIGKEEINNSKVYKLKLTKKLKDISIYFIDIKTYLLHKIVSMTDENKVISETQFSDYRKVGGIIFPFQIEIFANGELFNKILIQSVELNIEVEDSYFAKPENK